jgi:hypothetical protein
MSRTRWPLSAAGTYVGLTFLGWALILGGGPELGIKLALILGLPWSLFLASREGTGMDMFLLFGAAMLNALFFFLALRRLQRGRDTLPQSASQVQ